VADASPVPVLVYNIPKYTHLQLAAGLLRQLAAHTNIVGAKDSFGRRKEPRGIYRDAAPEWSVFVGSGSLLYAALELGCDGASLRACFAAALSAQVLAAFRAGDREARGSSRNASHRSTEKSLGSSGPPA